MTRRTASLKLIRSFPPGMMLLLLLLIVVVVDAKECYQVCPEILCPSIEEQKQINDNNVANCQTKPSQTHHGYCHRDGFDSCESFSGSPPPNSGSGPWVRFPYESSSTDPFRSQTTINYECWGSCACNVFGYDCTPCGYCNSCTNTTPNSCGQTPCDGPANNPCDQRRNRNLLVDDVDGLKDDANDDDSSAATVAAKQLFASEQGRRELYDDDYDVDLEEDDEARIDYNTYNALSPKEKQDRLVYLHCKAEHVTRDDQKFVDALESMADTNRDGVLSLEEFKNARFNTDQLKLDHCVSAKTRIQELEAATCNKNESSSKKKKLKK